MSWQNNMLKLGIYEHYKKIKVDVITIAKHSETLEEMVVYRHLDTGEVWVRPLKMFAEDVEIDGQKVPRFRYLSEK